MARPHPPSEVKIEGRNEGGPSNPISTHQKHRVKISAVISPKAGPGQPNTGKPSPGNQVRLSGVYSKTRNFANAKRIRPTGYGGRRRAEVELEDLEQNTVYYVRLFSEPREGRKSEPNLTAFWTERAPEAPLLANPPENATVTQGNNITFRWDHRDADRPQDPQSKAQLRWRVPRTSMEPPSNWVLVEVDGKEQRREVSANRFKPNTFYEWQVRTKDNHSNLWGPWSAIRSFYVTGSDTPPVINSPRKDEAVVVDGEVTLDWTFRDPVGSDFQVKADFRYRVPAAIPPNVTREAREDYGWAIVNGDPTTPGEDEEWTLPPHFFQAGVQYEWQVRTYDNLGGGFNPSPWSNSAWFRTISRPGAAAEGQVIVAPTVPQGSLGSGLYRVFAYDRGGTRYRGEITPFANLQWSRLRDDISSCTLRTNGFSGDCGDLLRELRCWVHEIVVFRDNQRVWEGPITRLGFHSSGVEIEARDVMAYVYRRIMRQGYNDRVRILKRNRQGKAIKTSQPRSVVDRAAIIIANALAPDDPNVLPWLTRFDFVDDAKQSRAVADWSKTAWEEVDDLAATAGLDYTTVGRRIILHDTHRPVGMLAELRNGDFFDDPIITEYGMSAANVFGVTSEGGLYGSYTYRRDTWGGAGPIEMLAGEYAEGSTQRSEESRAKKVQRLNTQASRNQHGRWPAPVVVRIPDNSRLNPEANVGIDQLIPGVHIPLRAHTPVREVAQMQKLDSVVVNLEQGEERVHLVLSPAPDPVDPTGEQDITGGDE